MIKAPSAALEKELAALQVYAAAQTILPAKSPCLRKMCALESMSAGLLLLTELDGADIRHHLRLLLSLADFENNKKRFLKEREDAAAVLKEIIVEILSAGQAKKDDGKFCD